MKETALSWLETGDEWLTPIVQFALVLSLFSILLAIPIRTRHWAGWIFLYSSWALGAKTWFLAAYLAMSLWGWAGLIIGTLLLGFGVVPVAIAAIFISGDGDITMAIILLIMSAITWAWRLICFRLMVSADKHQ